MKYVARLGLLATLLLATLMTAAAPPAAASPKIRIGLVLPDLSNEAISNINIGAHQRAKELGNVEILTTGSYSGAEQASAIEDYVAEHVDVIVYDSIDAAAVGPAILKANAAKIPVIAIFSAASEGKNATLIAPDFEADGRMIGRWMAGKLGKGGKVALVEGNPTDTAGVELDTGFTEGLAAGGITKLVASEPTDWDPQRAFTVTGDMLTAHPDIQGIYAAIDDIALSSLQAIKASGLEKHILLAGHNATCEGLAAMLRGGLDYTVMDFPREIGATSVDLAIKLKAGDQIPEVIKAQALGIDRATAQAVLAGNMSGIPPDLAPNVEARVMAAKNGCK